LRDELVERTVSRPLGAPTLVRLARLCQLRGASVAQIARLAAADPDFTASLLRIASTAPPGRPGPVADLPAAVARLGTRMVGMLAFAAPALRLLDAPEDELWEVRREIHRHAIRVGVVAREITPGSIQPEIALAAGLVHNVGLGMLSLDAPVGLRRALAAAAPGLPLWALEQEVFGFGHAELGGRLAREWRYPDYLVAAIEEHDAEMPSSPLAALIQVADLLVRERGVGVEPAMDIDPAVARMARIVPEQASARTRWLLAVDRGGARDRELRPDELSAVQLIRAFDRLERAA
jgi:HD-like signal output (HDOD) protein